jgi:lysophospholipase L1-like esterase
MNIQLKIYVFFLAVLLSFNANAKFNINNFAHIIIVGDSLSDQYRMGTGYIPYCPNPANGYWHNRFTNGRLWVDYFAADQGGTFADKIENLAVGGAALTKRGAGNLVSPIYIQIEQAYANHYDFSKSLFFIFGGSNDIKDYIDNGSWKSTKPVDLATKMDAQVSKIKNYITAKGGFSSNIVIIGLPPLNKIPKAKEWTQAQKDWAEDVVQLAGLLMLSNSGPSTYVSIRQRISDIIDGNKVYYGLTNVTDACSTKAMCIEQNLPTSLLTGGPYKPMTCEGKLFFDKVHPTSQAHCGISKWIAQSMAAKFDVAGFNDGDNIDDKLESCGLRRAILKRTWSTWGLTSSFSNSSDDEPVIFKIRGTNEFYPTRAISRCKSLCKAEHPSSYYISLGRLTFPDGVARPYCRCQID